MRPAIYDETEWNEIGRLLPTDTEEIVAPALALQQSAKPDERRRASARIVRDLRMALESITEPQPIPYHQKLWMCARLVRDGMRMLFASKDQTFGADAAAVAAIVIPVAVIAVLPGLPALMRVLCLRRTRASGGSLH